MTPSPSSGLASAGNVCSDEEVPAVSPCDGAMPVSLHTHSWYSLLEGVSSPEALLPRRAAEDVHSHPLKGDSCRRETGNARSGVRRLLR
jgi:hypothetical protein